VRPEFAVFGFEAMDEELSRPPLAAIRAMQAAGIVPDVEGWSVTPPGLRKAIAILGSQHSLDVAAIRALVGQIPPRHVRLVGPRREPDSRTVPPRLASALAGIHALTPQEWQAIHPFERFALDILTSNTRLLWRALDEMARLQGHLLFGVTTGQEWVGPLARGEVHADSLTLNTLAQHRVLDGRALDLARATGRRLARRAPELLDRSADRAIGPVELDCSVRSSACMVVWHGHVSSDAGEFLPGASLLAVAGAAAALCDTLREHDPSSRIVTVSIREEPWLGDPTGDHDDATQVYTPGR
jgi:hypothetical protein